MGEILTQRGVVKKKTRQGVGSVPIRDGHERNRIIKSRHCLLSLGSKGGQE